MGTNHNKTAVKTGIDQINTVISELKGKKLGLLTNQTGIDKSGKPTPQVLLEKGLNVLKLYAPEHGIQGKIDDAIPVNSGINLDYNLPITSLYTRAALDDTVFDDIDVLIMDIQDVGCRFYTFVNTMEWALKACSVLKKKVYVLDRPNPINGMYREGSFVEQELESFVGNRNLPIRHGCTVGELLSFFNHEKGIYSDLTIVKMKGWKREFYYDQTDLQFVGTSPNIRSLNACLAYLATCFFESVNVSEGRGTGRPFEWVGAPFIKSAEWVEELNTRNFEGVAYKSKSFTPDDFMYAREQCQGIELVITDRKKYNGFLVGINMIDSLFKLYPKDMEWTHYAEIPDRPYIDYLLGSEKFRKGEVSVLELVENGERDVDEFLRRVEPFLLYS